MLNSALSTHWSPQLTGYDHFACYHYILSPCSLSTRLTWPGIAKVLVTAAFLEQAPALQYAPYDASSLACAAWRPQLKLDTQRPPATSTLNQPPGTPVLFSPPPAPFASPCRQLTTCVEAVGTAQHLVRRSDAALLILHTATLALPFLTHKR